MHWQAIAARAHKSGTAFVFSGTFNSAGGIAGALQRHLHGRSDMTASVALKSDDPADGSRLDWVDATRGLLMILVIVLHASSIFSVVGWHSSFWAEVSGVMTRMRMPLFFFLSGLLAAPALGRSWGNLLVTRVANLVWLYLLWLAIKTVFTAAFFPTELLPKFMRNSLTTELYSSSTEYWFIYALALFFVGAKVIRKLNTATQLVSLGIISMLSIDGVINFINLLWDGVTQNFFFFVFGSLSIGLSHRFVEFCKKYPVACLLPPVWVAYVRFAPGAIALADIGILTTLVAIPVGISIGVFLRRVRLLRIVGRHTLPIYLTHILVTWALALLLPSIPETVGVLPFFILPASVCLAIACAVGMYKLSGKLGLSFFFAIPTWIKVVLGFGINQIRASSSWAMRRA
jgi:uncharacterized membrane protein YcfT